MPPNRLDAISVIIHEFGHAFGFNGFRSRMDGSLQGAFLLDSQETTAPSRDWAVEAARARARSAVRLSRG